jgi:signal transduction histidine kinase
MRRNTLMTGLAVVAWWTLYALVYAGQTLSTEGVGGEPSLERVLTQACSTAVVWIPITLALLACVERFPLQRGKLLPRLLLFAAFTAAVVLFRALACVALNPIAGWYGALPPFSSLLLIKTFNSVLLLWLMIGVAHAWWYARQAAERARQAEQLQARLVAARLEALSAQLDPHFLFNTLNAIAEMVHRDAVAADRMLVGLGELLRASLDRRRSQLVPLREELALLRHYLEIQLHRLGDRLQVHWDIAERVEYALVPPLLLQPLAENAIVHAIAVRSTPGSLVVRIRVEGDQLALEVEDDGGGERRRPSHGTGLANLRSRLECLYGREGELSLDRSARGGTCARVRIPLRRAAAAEAA